MNNEDESFIEKINAFCSAPLDALFRKFRAGVIYFGVGGITIYLANSALEPSIQQELVMLGGLLLGTIGFFIAIYAQLRMILSRIYNYFSDSD
jgi:hypothetical protein